MTGQFALDCTECPFETTVEGAFAEVQAVVDAHRGDVSAGATEHFVNVRRMRWVGDGSE